MIKIGCIICVYIYTLSAINKLTLLSIRILNEHNTQAWRDTFSIWGIINDTYNILNIGCVIDSV